MSSTCTDCKNTWTGLAKAHCVVCCETFSSNGTADLHWTKNGHVDPRAVKRLRQDDSGVFRQIGERPVGNS